MSTKEARRLGLFGWSAAIAAILQTVGLIRYVSRLPDDWVGITLYVVTLLAFIAVSIGSFIQAGQNRS